MSVMSNEAWFESSREVSLESVTVTLLDSLSRVMPSVRFPEISFDLSRVIPSVQFAVMSFDLSKETSLE